MQKQRRLYLIRTLLDEQEDYKSIVIPEDEYNQKRLLRSLYNVRMPKPLPDEFYDVEEAYLKEELRLKSITDISELTPIKSEIYLWLGDITLLKADAIVNAANSKLLGCFAPCHLCIDNCIHTFAGARLREECNAIMKAQGHDEETGTAKITGAYNLPSRFVIHTVGPIIYDEVTKSKEDELKSCYISCLSLADKNNVKSIAFPCISTGEFRFPKERAAELAIDAVNEYKAKTNSKIEVIFNVFKEEDYNIYRRLLVAD